MRKLTLADGTVVENAYVLKSGTTLWFYMEGGMTFDYAYGLMSTADRTAVIVDNSYGDETTYERYTDLFCLRREEDGMITGGLKQV